MNAPETSSSRSSPVSVLTSAAWPSAPFSPATNSLTVYGVSSSMFSCARARSSMIFDARNSSRRCTTVTLRGELRQEDRLLHRRVAAADDDRLGVAEEGRVAGRAVADPATAQLLLAGDAQLLVLGAHRQDDGARPVLGLADPHPVDSAGLARQLDALGLLGQQARAEALGLVAQLLHHLRAHDPLGEAGVVLHVGRLLQQPAPGEALDHERVQVGARGVQRRGVARRAAADDDHVLDVLPSHAPDRLALPRSDLRKVSPVTSLCKV